MTDKLHCPLCGAELEFFDSDNFPIMLYCDNINCNIYHIMGQYTLWQALIDGKKAQDALKEATKCINWTIDTIVKGLDREADIVGCCELSLERIDEITSIATQEKE